MAEEVLDSPDIDATFEEVGGEGMSQGVAGGAFVQGGFSDSLFKLALHGCFMEVVAGDSAISGMGAEGCGGENSLPRFYLMLSAEIFKKVEGCIW